MEGGFEAVFGLSSPMWLEVESQWPIETPGKLYESLLKLGTGRKGTGVYYTPTALVQRLLDGVMNPALASEAGDLGEFRFCDPACGVGHFLLPAIRQIGEALSREAGLSIEDALAIAGSNAFGIDRDPHAAELCRRAVSRLCGHPAAGIRCEDSLTGAPPEVAMDETTADAWCRRFAPADQAFFHWSLEYPHGFDLVIGNPPFVNAIERCNKEPLERLWRQAFPAVRGAADRSFYFLELASRIVRPGGWIGLVMPRSVLNAPAIEKLREHLHLRFVDLPSEHDHFDGAAVFICLLGCGPSGPCFMRREGVESVVAIEQANWWRALNEEPVEAACPRLGERFEVTGSMTASEAYQLAPLLADSKQGKGPKLLTTGLIEPNESLWGRRPGRYLGRKLDYPRITIAPPFLARRIGRAARPKIIVAGLSKRIECLLDPVGEYIGAVSTFTITHPSDDLDALRALEGRLHTDEATRLFHAELGANAMGGGSITMKRSFLEMLPL